MSHDTPTGTISDILPPEEVRNAAETVRVWAEMNCPGGRWIIGGVCGRAFSNDLKAIEADLSAARAALLREGMARNDADRQVILLQREIEKAHAERDTARIEASAAKSAETAARESLRDKFAAAALAGISAHMSGPKENRGESGPAAHARWSYDVARAMMHERGRQ